MDAIDQSGGTAMFGRIVRFVVFGFIAMITASTVGALIAKGRITSRGGPADDEVDLVAVMEELRFQSTAKAFRGGTALLWMGGGDIDLRDATLDPAGASIRLKVVMGGGRIIVPPTWRISTNVVSIMGGFGDSRGIDDDALPADAPHLELRGVQFMGGFGIVSDPTASPDQVAEVVVKAVKKNGRSAAEVETGTTPA
jgi:hypothetical protein